MVYRLLPTPVVRDQLSIDITWYHTRDYLRYVISRGSSPNLLWLLQSLPIVSSLVNSVGSLLLFLSRSFLSFLVKPVSCPDRPDHTLTILRLWETILLYPGCLVLKSYPVYWTFRFKIRYNFWTGARTPFPLSDFQKFDITRIWT